MEQELRRMFENKGSEMNVSSTMPQELRSRVGRHRMITGGLVAVAAIAIGLGGFAGARSISSDDALPPAEKDSNSDPFVDTWSTTDVQGNTRTMVIRATGEDEYDVTLHNNSAFVCSGGSVTLTGNARLFGSTQLSLQTPEITCDDGTEASVDDEPAFVEEVFHEITFDRDPETDILINYSPMESRRVAKDGQVIYNGRTLVWARADATNRLADVAGWITYGDNPGWITYGDNQGIWARDLKSPGDPSDRVQLSSTPGTPIAWSPDGSELFVVRDVKDSDSGNWGESDLFVLNSDGTETHLTRANGFVTGGSFSPDGSKVVYAVQGDLSTISVVDASGGTPDILRTHEWRSSRVCCLYGATFSPDGTQIAYFEGMYDHSNTLQVMNADGSGSRILVEREFGHVGGVQWSPDGSRLVFASGGIWVVGADGIGLKQVSSEEIDGTSPHWSPDGSHIAYMRSDADSRWRGNLEIVRLGDLKVQSFGDGASGPWTTELPW